MSEISDRIAFIKEKIHKCFDTNSPIDPKEIKELSELHEKRLKELVVTHKDRSAFMKEKTRALTAKMSGITAQQMKLNAPLMERIFDEQDKYDKAAIEWFRCSPLVAWEDSVAAQIAAGILILCGEVAE